MKKYLFSIIAASLCALTYGQGEIDAFRMSETDLSGTARGQAMAGSFGALGGDMTGVSINPAGIGIYRSSELNTTLGLSTNNIKTNWKNAVEKSSKTNFKFDNVSYVGYFPIDNGNLQSINFGFSYNKVQNFNRTYSATGNAMTSSLTDYMSLITNRDNVNYTYLEYDYDNDENVDYNSYDPYIDDTAPWLSLLGWHGRLLNNTLGTNHYNGLLLDGETANSNLKVWEKGNVDNYDFTLGTNFSNSFYLGMTLSLTNINYITESTYTEKFSAGGDLFLDNYLQTDGSGVGFNLGFIWRPTDALRLGLAYHSPTWYTITDYYSASIDTDVSNRPPTDGQQSVHPANGDYYYDETPEGSDQYNFKTPYSFVFSVAGVIGTQAVVNLDYEIKDYSAMKYSDRYREYNDYYDAQNENIDTDYKLASTLRLGLECRITPQLSARAGYAWQQHPYEKSFKQGDCEVFTVGTIPHYILYGDVNYLTAGLGYRFTPNFYIDAAVVYRMQESDLYFYPHQGGNVDYVSTPASFNNNTVKGLVTLGYKF